MPKTIDLNRYYEVTELHPDDAHFASKASHIGKIVKFSGIPKEYIPGFWGGSVHVIRSVLKKTASARDVYYAVALRPLSKKEQEKLNGS